MKNIKVILISSILVFSLDLFAAETGSQMEPPAAKSIISQLLDFIIGEKK